MKSFPMFFKTTGRRVVLVGGGEEAAQKSRLILKTDAEIVIVADHLEPELQGLVASGRARQHSGPVTPQVFDGCAFSMISTGCAGADAAFHALAKAAGAVVNVVDRPELCDIITPSIVDRDPVVVAIGTEGTAPVLGRRIKTEIETMLPPRLGALSALAGRLRPAVAAHVPQERRRSFWSWVFNALPAQLHAQGAEEEAARAIKSAIAAGGAPDAGSAGRISLVGAGPGARDLLTLRAVERLQEADVIFYDRLVDPEVLELARRDARRVFVGKTVGDQNPWPQGKISDLIVSEARQGHSVVRLKSGDPAIYGRADEEIIAAQAYDIPIEIVPGVTAASGAASVLGQSLTRRGETDAVVLATGMSQPGDPDPDWAAHLRAGTTVAFYMCVRSAPRIARNLMEAGAPPDTEVTFVSDATRAGQKIVRGTLKDAQKTLEVHDISSNTICLLRLPKAAAQGAHSPCTFHAQAAYA